MVVVVFKYFVIHMAMVYACVFPRVSIWKSDFHLQDDDYLRGAKSNTHTDPWCQIPASAWFFKTSLTCQCLWRAPVCHLWRRSSPHLQVGELAGSSNAQFPALCSSQQWAGRYSSGTDRPFITQSFSFFSNQTKQTNKQNSCTGRFIVLKQNKKSVLLVETVVSSEHRPCFTNC